MNPLIFINTGAAGCPFAFICVSSPSSRVPRSPSLMPLLVKDYAWHETDAEVVLKLPLKGVKPSKVDVTATDRFIKVSRVVQSPQQARVLQCRERSPGYAC